MWICEGRGNGIQEEKCINSLTSPFLSVTVASRMAPINYLEKNVIDLEGSNCYANIFHVEFKPLFVLQNKLPLPLEYERFTGGSVEYRFQVLMPGN